MNKELTPLEALNLLFELAYGHDTKPNSDYTWYAIVETALKDYAPIRKLLDKHSIYDLWSLECVLHDLKALEIIKEKFYFEWLFASKNVKQYNEAQDSDKNKLTQEEYDLLKEVLL